MRWTIRESSARIDHVWVMSRIRDCNFPNCEQRAELQVPALPDEVQRTLKDSEEDDWGPWASDQMNAEVLSEVIPGKGFGAFR